MNDNSNNHKSVLKVRDLYKRFNDNVAVDRVSFNINEGDFVALLGPNGAGKTTTIKMLTGLIKSMSGDIHYYGESFFDNMKKSKSVIGVVPQQSNLDRDLTAYENLMMHAILHGMPKSSRKEKIDAALEFAGILEQKNNEVRTFSGGMQRRLVIVRALLHEPKILFLDEPTVGLDPRIRHELWKLIIKINQLKKTSILMTTHYIEEADKLCDRVLIINSARIVAEDSPETLKNELGRYVLETFNEESIDKLFFATREEAVKSMKDSECACKIREVSLDDVFLDLTGRSIDA